MPIPQSGKGPFRLGCRLSPAKAYFFAPAPSAFLAPARPRACPSWQLPARLRPFGGRRGHAAASASGCRRFFADRDHVGHGRVSAFRNLILSECGKSLTRSTPCISSPLTSRSIWLGMLAGRHSISTSRNTWSRMPPDGLHAHRNSQQLHAHLHAQKLVQSNPLQVDVDQAVIDRLALPVHNHRLGRGLPGNLHVENGVMAGLGKQNPRNLLGFHFNGNRVMPGPYITAGILPATRTRRAAFLLNLPSRGLATTTSGIRSLVSLVRARIKQLLAASF